MTRSVTFFRRLLVAVLCAAPALGCSGAARPERSAMPEAAPGPRRVLFVCVENSNRSQMAEAFARLHGGGRVEAYSSGSRPSGKVNPRAIAFMAERGCDLAAHRSKALTDIPDAEYDAVVTMGCGDACPHIRARRREDWAIPDPKELPPEEFRAVRDLIEAKVKALLSSLPELPAGPRS